MIIDNNSINIKGIRVVATLNQWEINLIQINN